MRGSDSNEFLLSSNTDTHFLLEHLMLGGVANMNRPISREGDDTSHGGKIIRVTGTLSINGRRNARVGDWVHCPKHGDNQIVEPGGRVLDNGVPIVLHGCRSECGSTVISISQTTVET